jgi:hypothetical protein
MPVFSMSCVRSSSDFVRSEFARLGGMRGDDLLDDRMLRRHGQERYAEERVDARREDVDRRVHVLDVERERRAFAAADPVALHRLDAFGPALELVDPRQQSVRVGGDVEEPLREVAALDDAAAAPARAVDDLFVCEHGLIDGAPVHGRLAFVRETLLVHPQEKPLVPAVILGIAGRELAAPIVARAHQLDLAAHVGDVRARPRFGCDPALNRGVFRG